jgi:MarR-like DNA-binding transcriptional regulator SgrR of sgrS sRNA
MLALTGASAREALIADVYPLPETLDPTRVTSASHYIVLSHLVRPLVRLDAFAQVVGDLAESWTISRDFREFTFTLRSDARWSDGTLITASDVAATFEAQRAAGSAIHADFKKVVAAVAADARTLRVKLAAPNGSFLRSAAHPEFGVLRKPEAKTDMERFAVTSGPYVLKSAVPGKEFRLAKNPFHPGFAHSAPENVWFQSNDTADQLRLVRAGLVDFVMPRGEIAPGDHRATLAEPGTMAWRPHIGFTYWLSMNPNGKPLADVRVRRWLQGILAPGSIDHDALAPFWGPAPQLYLPDGIGRLSPGELDEFWRETARLKRPANAPSRLSLLVNARYPLKGVIAEKLKRAGVVVSTREYVTQDDFVRLMRESSYDLVLINNDFSSADLIENLGVTFNETRPLVMVPKGDTFYGSRLREAQDDFSADGRHRVFRDIASRLLSDGLVCPLSYFHVVGYHSASLDVSAWSKLFPEVSFWKATLKRTP